MADLVNFVDKSIWNSAPGFGINGVNVATVGEVNAFFANLGLTSAPQYGSQDDLGKRIILTEAGGASKRYTNVANLAANTALYGGIYQLVQLSASATGANVAQGTAAFFLDSGAAGYVVTDEAHANALNDLCGVFLNAITPGNYGIIQVHGKATVQYRAVVTATTAGSSVLVQGAGTGVFDAPTQSGNPTFLNLFNIIGSAIQAPANAGLKTVRMKFLHGLY